MEDANEIGEVTVGSVAAVQRSTKYHEEDEPSNKFAFMLGSFVQSKCGLALCSVLTMWIIGVNIADYVSKGKNVPYEVIITALTICSAMSLILVWIIKNGPYNLFKKVQETRNDLCATIENLNNTNEDLSTVNQDLRKTNTKFLQDLNEASVVTKGMQATLMNLLSEMNKRDGSLSKVTAKLIEEVSELHETTEESANKFRTCIIGMDKEITRSAQLGDQLNMIMRENMQLSTKLLRLTENMDRIMSNLEETSFNVVLQQIFIMVDKLGDDGLREKLKNWIATPGVTFELTVSEVSGLLQIFVRIDNTLKVTYEHKQAKDTQILRSLRSLNAREICM